MSSTSPKVTTGPFVPTSALGDELGPTDNAVLGVKVGRFVVAELGGALGAIDGLWLGENVDGAFVGTEALGVSI